MYAGDELVRAFDAGGTELALSALHGIQDDTLRAVSGRSRRATRAGSRAIQLSRVASDMNAERVKLLLMQQEEIEPGASLACLLA